MERNESIVRDFFEQAFNQGRIGAIDKLMSPDLAGHQNVGGREGCGAPERVVSLLRQAFSDFHLAVEDVASRGDSAWVRLRATGTHDGPYMAHPPTGRPIEVTVIDILRVANGKIVEHWGVPDGLASLRQIGVNPPGDHGGGHA
jgi:predicted ester cyclase